MKLLPAIWVVPVLWYATAVSAYSDNGVDQSAGFRCEAIAKGGENLTTAFVQTRVRSQKIKHKSAKKKRVFKPFNGINLRPLNLCSPSTKRKLNLDLFADGAQKSFLLKRQNSTYTPPPLDKSAPTLQMTRAESEPVHES